MNHNKDGALRLNILPHCRSVTAIVCVLLLPLCAGASTLDGQRQFNLAASDLSTAVSQFGSTLEISVLLRYAERDEDIVRKIRTRAVVGKFTPAEAALRMLAGTGITFLFRDERTLVLSLGERNDETRASGFASHEFNVEDLGDRKRPSGGIYEVLVTGTRLRNVFDIVSPSMQVGSEDLRRTGYATVHDALASLPIVSRAGASEDLFSFPFAPDNSGMGTSINLRGLGQEATLVLVNGCRQPVSGEAGSFVDVSNIPWAAVERIDIVPDGASAIYGSDAIAGTVNVIMRNDVEGIESQARWSTAPGGVDEILFSQLFGGHWTSGHAMLAYQYSSRAPLSVDDRAFVVNADRRPQGGADYRTFFTHPGNIVDPITLQPVYGIPQRALGTPLSVEDLTTTINLDTPSKDAELLPDRTVHSVYSSLDQTIGNRWALHLDARHSQRDAIRQNRPITLGIIVPPTNPYLIDPFEGRAPFVAVAYSFLRDLGPVRVEARGRTSTAALAATAALSQDWKLVLSGTYGIEQMRVTASNLVDRSALDSALRQTDPDRAFDPFATGTHGSAAILKSIRTRFDSRNDSTISSASAVLDGPLIQLPAGEARLAVGIEGRREGFAYQMNRRSDGQFAAQLDRNVASTFAEMAAPILGEVDTRTAPRLDLRAAVRLERYSDVGTTFNPRLGLQWTPTEAMRMRASWGSSFRAPKLFDRDTTRNFSGIAPLDDPKSPTGQSVALIQIGNNPAVQEETASTWTAGLDFVPTFMDGRVSLTYYRIAYKDRIITPSLGDPFAILSQEDRWSSIVNRHPTPEEIDAACHRADLAPGSPTCDQAPPTVLIDGRQNNFATTDMKGFDLELERGWQGRYGSLRLSLAGSYVLQFRQRDAPGSATTDLLDTHRNPLALRLRAETEWAQRPAADSGFSVAVRLNYTGGYQNPDSVLKPRVSPWTTLDLQVRYALSGSGWLSGMELAANAVNVSNEDPPWIDSEPGYDPANVAPVGRVLSLELRKRW